MTHSHPFRFGVIVLLQLVPPTRLVSLLTDILTMLTLTV